MYATVNAYDVMGQVFIILSVREQGDTKEESLGTVLHTTTTVPGSGETSPTEWAKDALVALLEVL